MSGFTKAVIAVGGVPIVEMDVSQDWINKARIAASAPELYEALSDIVARYEKLLSEGRSIPIDLADDIRIGRQVLAQSRGE